LAVGYGGLAQSCDTPIYRYALENWKPAHYKLVIFNSKTADTSEICDGLEAAHANLSVASVVVSADVPTEFQKLRDAAKNKPLPWMVLSYPEAVGAARPVWSGSCTKDSTAALLDSPARKSLIQKLASGDAAVWLLVDGGDSDEDDAKATLLQRSVETLSAQFSAAAKDDDDASAVVHFSFLRVAHDDPAEALLRCMLTERNGDAAEHAGILPRAYLIFGRGRAIGPLYGGELNEKSIADAASFLSGPCLCEIKEQNPGMDLLLNANWRELLPRRKRTVLNTSADTLEHKEPELKTSAAALAPSPTTQSPPVVQISENNSNEGFVNKGLLVAGLMIGTGIISLLISFRGRRGAS
jgi:hypothetical protein